MKTNITLPVRGMDCASCANIIGRGLIKLPGVEKADVNIATERASIAFDDEKINVVQMQEKVKGLGYELVTEEPISPMPMAGHDHMKMEKAAKLEKDRQSVLFAFPIALTIFILMMWNITAKYLPLPPFFLPMKLFDLVSLILSTIVLFGFGQAFIGAVPRFVKTKAANMDTLIGIGTLAAYFYSAFVYFFSETVKKVGLAETTYFDVVIVVIGFILLGKYLEARSKVKTGEAIEKLGKLAAKTALVIRHGKQMEIAIEEVVVGDILIVKPGTKIPVDGKVIEGASSIDESMVTGESIPIDKKEGDNLIGGTINKQGVLKMSATKVGSDTLLSQIIKMVESAQGSKAPIERIADQISAYFVPAVLVISVLTLLVWITVGSIFLPLSQAVAFGLSSFVGILVIACPCALGLATPTAIIVAVGKGAENGILIKDAESLEKLHSVNTVVMDKTGTLTKGEPEVVNIVPTEGGSDQQLMTLLSSLEANSEHPLAKAVIAKAEQLQIKPLPVKNFAIEQGRGLKGQIKKEIYYAGNITYMKQLKIKIVDGDNERYTKEGKTPVYLARSKRYLGAVYIADTLKETAVEAVKQLHALKLKVVMLTGDNANTAKFIADLAGVDEVIAQVLPDEKAARINEEKAAGRRVAMIGDGVNDAPALATADVGIAMGTGTDVAIESANITLLHGDLTKLVRAIRLSKKTMSTIRQNLFWAFIYNVLGIPLAAGVFYPIFGILLNPVFAGAAMALSSVSVVTNSLRLKGAKL
jgi:Cu2+-exporting ATPase/Cu+-exporting ATPase